MFACQQTLPAPLLNRTMYTGVVKAQIWDTAGQERFESMTKAYYRDAVGALLVYDVCRKSSFKNIRSVWMKQLKQYGSPNMRLVLGIKFV